MGLNVNGHGNQINKPVDLNKKSVDDKKFNPDDQPKTGVYDYVVHVHVFNKEKNQFERVEKLDRTVVDPTHCGAIDEYQHPDGTWTEGNLTPLK